jgi:hypothetical protein
MTLKAFVYVVAIYGISLVLLLTGCQERQQLKDMHNNTQQMNDTITKMAATTEAMKGYTEVLATDSHDLKGMTGELYDALRQGTALQIRKMLWETLFEDEGLDSKLVNSGLYFVAFEFELWSGLGQDGSSERRDLLAKDAVREFFNHLRLVSHWDGSGLNPFAQPAKRIASLEFSYKDTLNEKAVFNALSVTAHIKNRKQEFSADQSGIDSYSMYSLIENGLRAGRQIQSGKKKLEDFPEYVNEVLQNEDLAKRLLQARYNMLGLISLGKLSKISESFYQGIKLKMFGSKWSFDLNKLNQSQLRFVRDRFVEAQETRKLVEELGLKTQLNKDIKKMLSNLTLLNVESSGNLSSALLKKSEPKSDFDSDKQAFAEALRQYLI